MEFIANQLVKKYIELEKNTNILSKWNTKIICNYQKLLV